MKASMPHSVTLNGPGLVSDKHINHLINLLPLMPQKIQIDLVCLYPSIRSLKFQRFGVTQEFSTAVQCLPINNEEQTGASQGSYPLCFSSHCPLVLTKSCPWALMVPRSRFLFCCGSSSREDGAIRAADVL